GPEPHAARHRRRDRDRGAGRFRPAAAAAAGTRAGAARAEARPRPAAAGGAAGLRPRGERGAAAHLLGGARCEALRVFHRRARRLRPGSHARGPRARGARRAVARPGRSRVALWHHELEPAAPGERGAVGGVRHGGEEGFATREQNLTWTSELGPDNRIIAGRWWTAEDFGKPLVSLATEFQEALGVEVGDRLTFDIAGEPLEARVASIRKVK